MSRKIVFESSAFTDFNDWTKLDKKVQRKIIELIKDIDRHPFQGLGKPEALKHDLSGYWSRRINQEHRLVYKVTNEEIIKSKMNDRITKGQDNIFDDLGFEAEEAANF